MNIHVWRKKTDAHYVPPGSKGGTYNQSKHFCFILHMKINVMRRKKPKHAGVDMFVFVR